MSMQLTFDQEKHLYYLDGRPIPGVTQVIRYFIPAWRCDPWYLERGKAVHAAIALHIQGTLDESTIDPQIKGRVDALKRCLLDCLMDPFKSEWMMASERYRFAGTLDCVTYGGFVVDWKGSIDLASKVQLGAYGVLSGKTKGALVECHDDGTYKMEYVDLKPMGRVFLNMLSVYNFLSEHKLKNNHEHTH